MRGNAGSHDLAFSVQTLAALTKLTREGGGSLYLVLFSPCYIVFCFSNFLLFEKCPGMKLKLSRYDKVRMLGLKPLPVDTVKVVDPQVRISFFFLKIVHMEFMILKG